VLAEDIARALGSCGRLSSLRRDYVEPFESDPLVALAELETSPVQSWPLLRPDRAVAHLPLVRLEAPQAQALRHGQTIALPQAPEGRCRVYDPDGAFLGLGSGASGRLRVQRFFSAPLPP
jgi:tRNA pseudouridine55 synthase